MQPGSARERQGAVRRVQGSAWLALCSVPARAKLLPGLVVAAQVLNSIQERGYKSVGLLATQEGVFSWAPRIGFQWVKYINLATLHLPIPPEKHVIKIFPTPTTSPPVARFSSPRKPSKGT